MLFKKAIRTVAFLGVLIVATLAAAQITQDVEFYPIIVDSPDPVGDDGVVSYEIEVFNDGPDSSPQAVNLDITLPMGVPISWADYLSLDEDARNVVDEAFLDASGFSWDSNIWDDENSGTYMGDSFNNACAGLMVQAQSLVLPSGNSGRFYFSAELVPVGGVSGVAYAGTDDQMIELNYGRGGCNGDLFDSCGNGDPYPGWPCMGIPLTVHTATPAPIAFAGDGCQAEDFDGFSAGNVALIDRGDCYFYVKGGNATAFGASAVIIGNYGDATDTTPTHDSVMSMGCTDATCHSLFLNPSAFISYNDAEALKAAMQQGEVIGYLGVREAEPEHRVLGAYLWSNGGIDTNPDNNRYHETTTDLRGSVFSDGFESGDITAWSNSPFFLNPR